VDAPGRSTWQSALSLARQRMLLLRVGWVVPMMLAESFRHGDLHGPEFVMVVLRLPRA